MKYHTEMESERKNNYSGIPECFNFNKITRGKQAVKIAPCILVVL